MDAEAWAIADEYRELLGGLHVPARAVEAESDSGHSFVAVIDARYDDILLAIAGEPDDGEGYLVVPAPGAQEAAGVSEMLHSWVGPGDVAAAGDDGLITILRSYGLFDPVP